MIAVCTRILRVQFSLARKAQNLSPAVAFSSPLWQTNLRSAPLRFCFATLSQVITSIRQIQLDKSPLQALKQASSLEKEERVVCIHALMKAIYEKRVDPSVIKSPEFLKVSQDNPILRIEALMLHIRREVSYLLEKVNKDEAEKDQQKVSNRAKIEQINKTFIETFKIMQTLSPELIPRAEMLVLKRFGNFLIDCLFPLTKESKILEKAADCLEVSIIRHKQLLVKDRQMPQEEKNKRFEGYTPEEAEQVKQYHLLTIAKMAESMGQATLQYFMLLNMKMADGLDKQNVKMMKKTMEFINITIAEYEVAEKIRLQSQFYHRLRKVGLEIKMTMKIIETGESALAKDEQVGMKLIQDNKRDYEQLFRDCKHDLKEIINIKDAGMMIMIISSTLLGAQSAMLDFQLDYVKGLKSKKEALVKEAKNIVDMYEDDGQKRSKIMKALGEIIRDILANTQAKANRMKNIAGDQAKSNSTDPEKP